MGKNQRYYKIKDKKLTKNKKNAKLNKSLAFALSGLATLGATSMLTTDTQEAKAMMGKVTSVANKVNSSAGKIMKPTTGVHTSRVLRGSVGSINTGVIGNNGTPYTGLNTTTKFSTQSSKHTGVKAAVTPTVSTNTGTIHNATVITTNKTTAVKGNLTPTISTNTGTIHNATSSVDKSSTATVIKNGPKGILKTTGVKNLTKKTVTFADQQTSKLGKNVSEKVTLFNNGSSSKLVLKNGKQNQQAFNQQGNTNNVVLTTEGFHRK